jgi:hypothetical protein
MKVKGGRQVDIATQPYQPLPTSLELLRQLEACVRELLEIGVTHQ